MKTIMGFLFFLFAAHTAQAALLQVDSSGQLTGALGVNVSGDFYDVSFLDGTCVAIYDGCAASDDFTFTTQAGALAAAAALLDQVFLDTELYNFDTQPDLTDGCTHTGQCIAFIPYALIAYPERLVAYADNRVSVDGDYVISSAYDMHMDTGHPTITNYVQAYFSQAAEVPIPAAGWLFMTALVGLVGKKRLSRR